MNKEQDSEAMLALGWMYAYACICLDKRINLRKVEVPEILAEYEKDMAKETEGET